MSAQRFACPCGRDFATSGGRATHQRTCEVFKKAGELETDKMFDDAPATAHLRSLLARLDQPKAVTIAKGYYGSGRWGQTEKDREDLDRLSTLQDIIDAATAEQHRIVRDLRQPLNSYSREARGSWQEIGDVLGISKQLASHRFSKAPRKSSRESG